MLNKLAAFIEGLKPALLDLALRVAGVATLLLAARRSGQDAEKHKQTKQENKFHRETRNDIISDKQFEARLRSDADFADRVREGLNSRHDSPDED